MNIVDFGFFKVVEDTPENPQGSIIYYENEDGQDWYAIRVGLTEWDETGKFVNAVFGAWALVDADGVVTNVEYDPSRLAPMDRRILGIEANWKEIKLGMIYRDGELQDGEPLPWMLQLMEEQK